MGKKYFDIKLYINGLKQLRLTGTIFLILSVLGTALPALFMILRCRQEAEIEDIAVTYDYSISSITILLAFSMVLGSVVMCITLFSFLNSRKGSDFYHSLPSTRAGIFLSFTAAVLTWLFSIIIISLSITILIYCAFGAPVNYIALPYIALTYISYTALITACMLLAMSITGTYISNIAVFGLILLLPRFITTMFAYFQASSLKIITVSEFGIFFNPNYNIPVKFLLSLVPSSTLGIEKGDAMFASASAIIYTFILAVIYFGLACLLFYLRKSEMAGRSAPNRILQHVYRCAVTLPLTLVIPCTFITGYTNIEDYWENYWITDVTVAVISLIIYFLFELVTAKKLKNLLKAAPVFLFIVLADCIFGYSMITTRNGVYNIRPSAGDIESVTMDSIDNVYGNSTKTFNDIELEKISFNDSQVISTVADSLSDSIDEVKNNNEISANLFVKIRLKTGKTIKRLISVSSKQNAVISKAEQANVPYTDALTGLPDSRYVKYVSIDGFSEADSQKIWETFQSEYNSMSVSQKEDILNGKYTSYALIHVQGYEGFESFSDYYSLGKESPETFKLYLQLYNNQNKSKVEGFVRKIMNGEIFSYSYAIQADDFHVNLSKLEVASSSDKDDLGDDLAINHVYEDSKQTNKFVSTYPIANDKEIFGIISKYMDESIDLSQPLVELSFYDENYNYYMNLSKEDIDKILKINQGISGK